MENGLGDERMVLDTIKGPEDVKRLSEEERKELAAEIREFLIETTSRTGGHLASNLGVVELTIAMFCAAAGKSWETAESRSLVSAPATGRNGAGEKNT